MLQSMGLQGDGHDSDRTITKTNKFAFLTCSQGILKLMVQAY